jgi:carbon monoxide dehydrogenase subunit G
MRRAKLFFIGILILLGFLCFITVFLPSKITVSKWININANKNAIAMQINDFNNWKNWYPAFQNKNIRVNIYRGNDTSFVTLTHENGKKISLALLKSSPENINILLSEGKKNTETYQFVLLPNGSGQTQVTWNVNIELGWYPWKKLGGILLDKVTGPRYEAALQNLKKAAEKNIP